MKKSEKSGPVFIFPAEACRLKPEGAPRLRLSGNCAQITYCRILNNDAGLSEAQFQGIGKLVSKKFVRTVFQIIMTLIGYNLMNLFLNSENCETFESFSLKTLRQKRKLEKNAKFLIYTTTAFASLCQNEFIMELLSLKESARLKLLHLFEELNLSPAPG
jgi:capsule polysaccharide export protein KpsC/LpsZ